MNHKITHMSFQKILSNPSSLVSSSVTPPKSTPVPFAAHNVIVHPLRIEGAYASDGLLRLSHLKMGPMICSTFVDAFEFVDFEFVIVGVSGKTSGRLIL